MKVSNVAMRTRYESEQCCNGGHVMKVSNVATKDTI